MRITVNGERYHVEVLSRERSSVTFRLGERSYRVAFENESLVEEQTAKAKKAKRSSSAPAVEGLSGKPIEVRAPIPGVITEILCAPGDTVSEGDTLLRLEAMKMQNSIAAPANARVEEVLIEVGDETGDGDLLVRLLS